MPNKPRSKTGSGKAVAAKKRGQPKKVSVTLPADLAKDLETEFRRVKSNGGAQGQTISSYMRDLVAMGLARRALFHDRKPESRHAAYKFLLQEAKDFKTMGKKHLDMNEFESAKAVFLASASRELEALSVLSGSDEMTIKSAVIEIVFLIKAGTGYNYLPEVPSSRPDVKSAS